MRIAIVDDEMHWRTTAKQLVSQHYSNVEVDVDIYESGEEYLDSKIQYDISFVDIEMYGIDGFETIERARAYNPDGVYIILTSICE